METQSVEYPQCTLADSFLRSGAARLVAYPFRMRQSDGHSSRSRPNWRKINQRPLQWEASSKKKKRKENRKVNLSFPNRIDIHRMLGPRPAPNSISPPSLSFVLKLISTHLSSQQPSRNIILSFCSKYSFIQTALCKYSTTTSHLMKFFKVNPTADRIYSQIGANIKT